MRKELEPSQLLDVGDRRVWLGAHAAAAEPALRFRRHREALRSAVMALRREPKSPDR